MDIHEYQAKERFALAGIPVPPGTIATTADEAEAIANEYACAVMVKAQVHSGHNSDQGTYLHVSRPHAVHNAHT